MTDPILIAALFAAGLVLGGLAVYVLAALPRARAAAAAEAEAEEHEAEANRLREDLREATVRAQQTGALAEKLEKAEAGWRQAERELEASRASAAERDKAHRQQVETLTEFRQAMEEKFKALAGEALEKQSETFAKNNQEKVTLMLSPLKEQITKFEAAFKEDGNTRSAQTATLRHMFEQLEKQTGQISKEATDLTNALKGSAQQQGAWGEMILETILEKSGLREGEEFVTQTGAQTTEDGNRLRPDVVVNLPNDQKLVIDSKVSLVAFERCVNCEEEAEREAHLKRHLASVRNHIKGLSGKDYSQLYGGVDFVVLFVPIESALSLAIQHDSEVQGFAASNNVMIASPNTLLMALRTVQNLWRIENQNRNAQSIAEEAGKMYDKLALFVSSLEGVGSSLAGAQKSYDKAMNQLSTGRGNVLGRAEKLKRMGASASKSLPSSLTSEDAEDEAGETAKPRLIGGQG